MAMIKQRFVVALTSFPLLLAGCCLCGGAALALDHDNTRSGQVGTMGSAAEIELALTESEKLQVIPYDLEIAADPSNATLLYHRGLVYSGIALSASFTGGGTPRRQKAIENFSMALKLDPKNIQILQHRAAVFEDLDQLDKALDDYKSVLAINPADSQIFHKIGCLYVHRFKDSSKTIEPLNTCISLDPGYATAYFTRAIAREELGETDKALVDYTKAIDLDPGEDSPYFFRGRLFKKLGQQDKARQDDMQNAILSKSGAGLEFFNAVIAEQPGNIPVLYRRAKRLSLAKQYRSALDDLTQIIKLKSDSTEAYFLRGQCWAELHDQQKAIDDLTTAINLDPNGAQALHWKDSLDRATVYLARGQAYWGLMIPGSIKYHQKAIADYTSAISLGTNDFNAYLNRGSIYGQINDFHKQVADLTKAISIEPRVIHLYESRASAFESIRQFERAVQDWTQAVRLISEDRYQKNNNFGDPKQQLARALANRGLDFRRLGDRAKAKADFSTAISIYPSIARNIESDIRWEDGRF